MLGVEFVEQAAHRLFCILGGFLQARHRGCKCGLLDFQRISRGQVGSAGCAQLRVDFIQHQLKCLSSVVQLFLACELVAALFTKFGLLSSKVDHGG